MMSCIAASFPHCIRPCIIDINGDTASLFPSHGASKRSASTAAVNWSSCKGEISVYILLCNLLFSAMAQAHEKGQRSKQTLQFQAWLRAYGLGFVVKAEVRYLKGGEECQGTIQSREKVVCFAPLRFTGFLSGLSKATVATSACTRHLNFSKQTRSSAACWSRALHKNRNCSRHTLKSSRTSRDTPFVELVCCMEIC